VIRAASGITGATEILIVGSQSVLGQFPDAPDDLLVSIEADVFTFRDPGECRSHRGFNRRRFFHQTFGYYAHGVAEETAVLPRNWKNRLIPVRNENTGNGCGLCLEIHDLAVAKLVAGREKDCEFIRQLLHHDLAKVPMVEGRLRETPLSNEKFESALARLRRLAIS
jgi:hypothetical protein